MGSLRHGLVKSSGRRRVDLFATTNVFCNARD